MKRTIIAILVAALWVSFSEFLRNQLLFKSYWIEHYAKMSLVFPAKAVNGVFWGVWSLLFAILVYIVYRKFNRIETTLICWFSGFLLMWVAIGNLNMLPFRILYFAVPLSLLESFVATWIISLLKPKKHIE